jgi:hypothetical protein
MERDVERDDGEIEGVEKIEGGDGKDIIQVTFPEGFGELVGGSTPILKR